MSFSIKKILPHFLVFVGFIILSLAYFSPVLKGKQIYQSDIKQYIGMSKQQTDFKTNTGEETYWTNSAFGGMPTYQLGARYPHNYIKKLDLTLRFLPRPADYLFLYFIGFYILLLVLKVDYKLAALGALSFGFSTYLIIILGVGHNSKAHAIAYMPLVLSGIILTFRRNYIVGFLLTTVAMALQLVANHPQMTYYLMLLVIVLGIAYMVDAYNKNLLPHYFKSVGLLVVAVILALGLNATSIMATKEYADESTRSKSELTINPDGSPKEPSSGLSKEYITEYSYGFLESFNLYISRITGGGNNEDVGKDSASYDFFIGQRVPALQAKEYVKQTPTYWGSQPIVEAPAYVGAVVIFLFVFALFLVKGRLKWWLVGGTIMSLLLSYGKNLGFLTDFFIDYVPFYNKFRAVSSVQVILELCIPVLAIFGLSRLFNNFEKDEEKLKALKYSIGITAGIAILLLIASSGIFRFISLIYNDLSHIAYILIGLFALVVKFAFTYYKEKDIKVALNISVTLMKVILLYLFPLFLDFLNSIDFVGVNDGYYKQSYGQQFIDALRDDRKMLFTQDTIRTLILVLLSAGTIFMFLKKKLSETLVIVAFAALILFDLVSVDRRYVNTDNFVSALQVKKPYKANPADLEILKDTTHYRVFDIVDGSARASYFHNSLGGYHAAKLKRYDELFDFHVARNNMNVLNMLNTKYIIAEEEGKIFPFTNTDANGNAWFVEKLNEVQTANQEIKALDSLNTRREAVYVTTQAIEANNGFHVDSLANIALKEYKPNYIKYQSNNANSGFAVFSEIYYGKGWNAYINGELKNHYRVDYVLRGMEVPKGKNTIEFKFEPQVVQTGSNIALASSILFGLVLLGGLFLGVKKK